MLLLPFVSSMLRRCQFRRRYGTGLAAESNSQADHLRATDSSQVIEFFNDSSFDSPSVRALFSTKEKPRNFAVVTTM